MYSSFLLLWIIVENVISGVCTSTCKIHDKCLSELRSFTQVEEFHVYTSIEEAEVACNDAKDAYLCVTSAPMCRNNSDKVSISPILRGGSRLLNEFCGFRAKRRPCCALRTAYLEHSGCYEEVSDRLNYCNDKYRTSLEMILDIEDGSEQNEQRFCSLRWFGNCVKRVTQSYCGKAAAQIIRSYAMKAGQYHKAFVQKNNRCQDTMYGQNEVSKTFCQQKHFEKCHVHLLFLHEYLIEDRLTAEDKLLSICTGIHDSFECLNRAFKRCLLSSQGQKFEKIHEMDDETEKNDACFVKDSFMQRYDDIIHCLAEHIPQLEKCRAEFENPSKYTSQAMPFHYYTQYFCGSIGKLEYCLTKTASSLCGHAGQEVMHEIIQMATIHVKQRCDL